MAAPDLLYLTLIAAVVLIEHFVVWQSFLRRLRSNASRARLWLWSCWMIALWTQVAAGVALWLSRARSWESLRLITPSGWRLWLSVVLVLALAIQFARPIARITRSKRQKRIKMSSAAGAERFLPHTQLELGWFVATSVSAGIGEEFVYRGYLIWAFAPLMGVWSAAALSVVVFALAHLYQGRAGALVAGTLGVLFTLAALILGSLWPVMILHAVVDIGVGLIAWLVLSQVQAGSDQLPPEEKPVAVLAQNAPIGQE